MIHFLQSSLRRKLIVVIMLTVAAALVLAVGAFVTIEIAGFRMSARREFQILAEVVGESSSAALEFHDPAEAGRLLSNLRVHKRIEDAAIIDREGRLFATYHRDGGEGWMLPAELPGQAITFEGNHLWMTHPIRHADDTLGTIYLRADLKELRSRLILVLLGGLALALIIGSLAMLMAARMGRLLSEPILHLTDAARRMARRTESGKSLRPERVPRESSDEVGVLVDAFNDMLDQLAERQTRLEETQQMAHLGSWSFDPEAYDSEWSEETYRIFGLEPGTGVPDQAAFHALIYQDDRAMVDEALRKALAEDSHFEIDHRINKPDGTLGWVHVSGARFAKTEGRPVLRGTIMDITDRKRAEAAMLQGQKLESLGVLTGGIAHDFNNLLAAMQGYLDMAQMNLHDKTAAAPFIDKAGKVVQRASDLIRQMLAYSGRGRFEVKRFSLNNLVKEMGHLLSVSISKKVELRFDLEEALPQMTGDSSQIQQVIMNLVINASEALKGKEGIIQIRTKAAFLDDESLATAYPGQALSPGSYLALEVEDNGHGMNPETLARIFDPFFTTKFTGRGLGLAAMLGIVKGHQGGIRVYSEVDRGTTFKVLFPAAAEGVAESGVKALDEPYQGTGTVLLVDDEPDLLASTAASFRSMGFEVLMAADGLEGLEMVRQHHDQICLALLDYVMPHMDGAECFRAIRTLAPSLPVLLTSGFNEDDTTTSLTGLGLAGFLQKPYTLAQLRAKVREVLL